MTTSHSIVAQVPYPDNTHPAVSDAVSAPRPMSVTECYGESKDLAGFRRDVLPLMGFLLRDAKRLTSNHPDAEDLVQETLLHAYKGFHGFQQGTNLKAWLRRIMRNRWISDHRRMESRPREVLTNDVGNPILESAASSHSAFFQRSAEHDVLAAMPDSDLRAAIAALSRDSRLVLYYADVEGYPHREVAEILNIPVGTVMSRLHRGRRRLRAELISRRLGTAPGVESQAG